MHVLPVDSEHNAIFQCLEGRVAQESQRLTPNAQRPTSNADGAVTDVRRIILTASGGPFRETPAEQFSSITVEQALKHPTWNMIESLNLKHSK